MISTDFLTKQRIQPVCTENSNPNVMMVKRAKDRV
jgi:hypothetical protein